MASKCQCLYSLLAVSKEDYSASRAQRNYKVIQRFLKSPIHLNNPQVAVHLSVIYLAAYVLCDAKVELRYRQHIASDCLGDHVCEQAHDTLKFLDCSCVRVAPVRSSPRVNRSGHFDFRCEHQRLKEKQSSS